MLREELAEGTAPLLKRAGVRSFTRFAVGAKQISVSCEEGKIIFTPSRNGGRREGFVPLLDKTLEAEENATLEQLGRLAWLALENAL